jgi:hypothetical protein
VRTFHGWRSLFECVAIPFAIGYAVVTYFQWRDLRTNFVIDQRAWLGVTEAIAGPIRETMRFSPILVNCGKTVALDVVHRGGWKPFPKSVVPDIEEEISKNPDFVDGVMFPSGKRELSNALPNSLTKEDADKLAEGSLVLYVFADVRYRDIFGNKRGTRFCLMLDPEPNKFVPCPFFKDSAY